MANILVLWLVYHTYSISLFLNLVKPQNYNSLGYVSGQATVVVGEAAAAGAIKFKMKTRVPGHKDMMYVTRYGEKGTLEVGDWIMQGKDTWGNYIRSGKWQPQFMPGNNKFARKSAHQTFAVPKNSVVNPYLERGWNFVKKALGQKRYKP